MKKMKAQNNCYQSSDQAGTIQSENGYIKTLSFWDYQNTEHFVFFYFPKIYGKT